jgi:S-adenosylmethionine:diacylglycerol 3-amino-3-carboxypropyl transferase
LNHILKCGNLKRIQRFFSQKIANFSKKIIEFAMKKNSKIFATVAKCEILPK